MARFTIYPDAGEPFVAQIEGRDLWALERLIGAGAKGCTPITEPAPRWSAYIHKLRRAGIQIETRHEPHGGPFPGHHARYVLQSRVTKGAGSGDCRPVERR
ncbi:winged helix domain-containing protein [Paracoccus yeei]|uniref:winged helix domain-containing protein n=1 Tax=Paracoccus yeei TaxID=147645 RepID=UPI003BF800BC